MQPKAEGRVEVPATADQSGAIRELVADGRRTVRVFSDFLDPQLFDNADLVAELSRVARLGRQCQVRILVKNSLFLVKRSHRLATLHRRLPSSVPIRKLTYSPDHFVANYVLIDDCGVFFIPNEEDKVCFANNDDRPLVKHLIEQFDDLWDKSSPDPELRDMPM